MVHLSDIHFGQEDKDGTFHHQDDVRDAVTRDCKVLRERLGPVNGILVTGDIAYAGKKADMIALEFGWTKSATLWAANGRPFTLFQETMTLTDRELIMVSNVCTRIFASAPPMMLTRY
ncbi:hypothetical protein ACQ5SK_18580 [Bradyrhizobium japonicum]